MPSETTIIPLEIIPLKEDGFHCFVDVMINKNIPARMIVDTGASRTILDLKLIRDQGLMGETVASEEKATGLGTNSMQGFTLLINSLKLGTFELKKYLAGILDLSHVNETYQMIGLPEIHGAIGSDILYFYKAKIDFGDKTLTLNRPKKGKK
jgi:hypothetical protein